MDLVILCSSYFVHSCCWPVSVFLFIFYWGIPSSLLYLLLFSLPTGDWGFPIIVSGLCEVGVRRGCAGRLVGVTMTSIDELEFLDWPDLYLLLRLTSSGSPVVRPWKTQHKNLTGLYDANLCKRISRPSELSLLSREQFRNRNGICAGTGSISLMRIKINKVHWVRL